MIKWSGAPPEVLGTWRLLGASLLLFLFFTLKHGAKSLYTSLKPKAKIIILTGAFFFFHLWSYFYSAQNTKIANCMILFATNPLFTALGAFIIFKEKLRPSLIFSYAIAFFSLYLLLSNTLEFNPENFTGEISGLVSGLFYSAYILSSKKARVSMNNWHFVIGIYFVCGVLFFLLTLYKQTPLWGYSDQAWLGILGTILIPTFLGHALFSYLMNYLNINWMSCGKLLEPILSAFVAFLLFNEPVTNSTKISFGLTLLALMILFYPKLFHQNKPKPSEPTDCPIGKS